MGYLQYFSPYHSLLEHEADEYIIASKDEFRWFPHMWSHMEPTRQPQEQLCDYMTKNKLFQAEHDLPLMHGYAISPHHTGVYPLYPGLIDCWRQIWNVTITSTEEYPHLNPEHEHRGFIHQELRVLPRQTCFLFTTTLSYKDFPKGPEFLEQQIEGGMLFEKLALNRLNIFMTHQQNYGNIDRLAIYTFDKLFTIFDQWTNFNFHQPSSEQIATMYFEWYPEEIMPLWTNPCDDIRHLEMMAHLPEESITKCKHLPAVVIVGPQKTGSTALMDFLELHPDLKRNIDSKTTFEEIQFFSSNELYKMGWEWYADYFPSKSSVVNFEKSATYFTSPDSPERMHSLLPNAKIIIILRAPDERAYSWYQHQKSHDIKEAVNTPFIDILNSNRTNPGAYALRSRCLDPGNYIKHIARWTKFYSPDQLIFVDGDKLTSAPAPELNLLQNELRLTSINFTDVITYNEKKGYFCSVTSGKTKCLGKSKV